MANIARFEVGQNYVTSIDPSSIKYLRILEELLLNARRDLVGQTDVRPVVGFLQVLEIMIEVGESGKDLFYGGLLGRKKL